MTVDVSQYPTRGQKSPRVILVVHMVGVRAGEMTGFGDSLMRQRVPWIQRYPRVHLITRYPVSCMVYRSGMFRRCGIPLRYTIRDTNTAWPLSATVLIKLHGGCFAPRRCCPRNSHQMLHQRRLKTFHSLDVRSLTGRIYVLGQVEQVEKLPCEERRHTNEINDL